MGGVLVAGTRSGTEAEVVGSVKATSEFCILSGSRLRYRREGGDGALHDLCCAPRAFAAAIQALILLCKSCSSSFDGTRFFANFGSLRTGDIVSTRSGEPPIALRVDLPCAL